MHRRAAARAAPAISVVDLQMHENVHISGRQGLRLLTLLCYSEEPGGRNGRNPLVAPLPALRHISFRVGEGRRASLAPVAERGPAVRQVEACKAAEAAANVQQRLVHQVDAGAQVQIPQTRPPLGRHWLEELQLQVKGVSYHIFVSQVAPRPSGGCTSARALRHVAYFSTPAVSAPSEAKILEVLLGF